MKKAITHLKLSDGNAGKLAQLDAVAVEYLRVVQADIDWLIAHEVKEPDKYADLPDLTTPLSARWQRCAWQQACGTVQSWYANERTHPRSRHRPTARPGSPHSHNPIESSASEFA